MPTATYLGTVHYVTLNRSTVVYDLPFADVDDKSLFTESDHSSQNPSGMISSSLSDVCSEYSSPRPTSSDQDSSLSSIGSPTVASSPKPIHYTGGHLRKSKSLRFLCINFQSARKKGKDIATLVETVCPDVILGTETWLSPDVCSSEVFDDSLGYDIHRNDRSENPHGGVLIAAKKDLELHDVKCSKDVELISGTINVSKQKKMVISSFYRPPSKVDEGYLNKSSSEISNLRKDSKKSVFILGGDFNVPDISWKDNTITSSKNYPRRVSQTYLDIASDLGLEQMVSFPTRGDNTLDLIFTSHPSYQERCKPLPPISAKSDHDIVLFDTAHQPVRARPKRRTIYLWKKADIDGIVKSLTAYGERFFNSSFTSVNSMWQDIKGAIDQAITDHVPTKRTPARHTHPWIDTRIRRATRRKNRAYYKARKTKNPIDLDRYKRLRTQTQKDIRSAHKKYMEEVVSNDLQENPKVFWSYIKSKRQESTGVAPVKNKDGFIHSDSSSKVEILNEQFVSAYTREDKSNIPRKGPSQHPTMDSIRCITKAFSSSSVTSRHIKLQAQTRYLHLS